MAKKSVKKPDHRNGPAPARSPYFLSISLENVRCFGDRQTLKLSDEAGRPARWTIILGNNGTGKTTLLRALVTFSSPLAETDSDAADMPYPRGWPGHRYSSEGNFFRFDRSANSSVNLQVELGYSLGMEDPHPAERASASFQLKRPALGPGLPFPMTVSSWDPPHRVGPPAELLPACYGYGAGRHLAPASLSQPESDDPVANLFFDSVPLRNAEEWLLQLDYSASKPSPIQQRQKDRLGQVQNLLLHILPEVEDIRISEPTQAQPTPRVEFHTPYGWVHLRALGYGYQTLIAWMVDLASRLIERFPDSPDPLAEPAVVLVDEIDLHLHPQWQRKLIGHLTARFPNTQFIATAHSPLVVQAAEDANLAVLRREGNRVIIDNDVHAVRGWRIDQIYTSDLFGLESARPPKLDRALARRTELLSKPTLSAGDQEELKELEDQIGSLPAGETAEQAETLRLIQESLELLKKGAGSRP